MLVKLELLKKPCTQPKKRCERSAKHGAHERAQARVGRTWIGILLFRRLRALVESKGVAVCAAVTRKTVVHRANRAQMRGDGAVAVRTQRQAVGLPVDGLARLDVPVVDHVPLGGVELHAVKRCALQDVAEVNAPARGDILVGGDDRGGHPLGRVRNIRVTPYDEQHTHNPSVAEIAVANDALKRYSEKHASQWLVVIM
jgi:hypothetical protein